MGLMDILGKLFKKGGNANNIVGNAADMVGNLGLDAILEKLQGLGDGADANDQKSIFDIVEIVKKALSNKDELAKIAKQCIEIAKNIGNGDLRETVMKLFGK